MLFNWFNASEAEKFGLDLAEIFAAKFTASEARSEKKAVEKRAQLLQKLFMQIRQFSQTHKLNIYKKAKLGNAFKWKLLELGYDKEFVDALTKDLLVEMK